MANPESTDDGPSLEIRPEAQAQLDRIAAEDPEAAKAMRDVFATLRQAVSETKAGRYKSFEEAMAAMGFPVERIEVDEEPND